MGAGRLEFREQESVSGIRKTRNFRLILLVCDCGFKAPSVVLPGQFGISRRDTHVDSKSQSGIRFLRSARRRQAIPPGTPGTQG